MLDILCYAVVAANYGLAIASLLRRTTNAMVFCGIMNLITGTALLYNLIAR